MAEAKKQLKFKKLHESAKAPTRAYDDDAGFDLYNLKKFRVSGYTTAAVQTGIALQIPKNYFGMIRDRSGFASRHSLTIKAGVIDSGYRGEIGIIFANHGPYPIIVEVGNKIAQIVILPVPKFELQEVDKLSPSDREEAGFGSTDNK